jgi:8-oxo-dGTP pyrophosphatase MutT (NUDIX family)
MDLPVQILAYGPFLSDNVEVFWQQRPPIPADVGAYIDQRWERCAAEARNAGRKLFNSSVIHLVEFSSRPEKLVLHLASTDYKTFLVTCLHDHAWFTQNHPSAITPAMGNSILLTHHGEAILGLRSGSVAYYAGRAHIFGGVMDWPGHAVITSAPILDHLYRELHEELGISAAALAGAPQVLGIFYDPALHQPELVWHAPLAGSATLELKQFNPDEHEKLIRLPLDRPDSSPAALTPVAAAVLRRAADLRL